AIALATRFLSANMRLAANLRPDLGAWLEGQIAKRAVSGSRRPRSNLFQLILLRAGEEIVLLFARAQKPARTNVILAAFDQCRIERLCENFLQNRNVFVEKLLLQIDGVRRDDGLFLLVERKPNRRTQIG